MKSFNLILILLTLNSPVMAQDERFYRRIFTGELFQQETVVNSAKIIVQSEVYKIDLNNDGEHEGIVQYKKDAIDYLSIIRPSGAKLLEVKLPARAPNAKIDKIYLKSLNETDAVLIVHFYEGVHGGVVHQASGRLFFISFKIKDLSNFKFFEGPQYFHELEKTRDQFELRGYTVNVVDLNNDGVKEIVVHYNNISRIFFYRGEGRWSGF